MRRSFGGPLALKGAIKGLDWLIEWLQGTQILVSFEFHTKQEASLGYNLFYVLLHITAR